MLLRQHTSMQPSTSVPSEHWAVVCEQRMRAGLVAVLGLCWYLEEGYIHIVQEIELDD